MSVAKTMAGVFVVTALAVVLPRLAWTMLDAYVLASPGGRLPLSGGVAFSALYVTFAAAVSGLVASALAGMAAAAGALAGSRVYATSALVGGLILSGGTFLIPSLASHAFGRTLFGDIGSIAVTWAAISAAVLAVAHAGVLRSKLRGGVDGV